MIAGNVLANVLDARQRRDANEQVGIRDGDAMVDAADEAVAPEPDGQIETVAELSRADRPMRALVREMLLVGHTPAEVKRHLGESKQRWRQTLSETVDTEAESLRRELERRSQPNRRRTNAGKSAEPTQVVKSGAFDVWPAAVDALTGREWSVEQALLDLEWLRRRGETPSQRALARRWCWGRQRVRTLLRDEDERRTTR